MNRKIIVCDANVIIDYFDNNKSVLSKCAAINYETHVPRQILEEVGQMDEAAAVSIGLKIYEPELSQLLESKLLKGTLSFQDWLCLIISRDEGWTCLTNEKPLYKKCQAEGVEVIRGFSIMYDLCSNGHLSKKESIDTATKIKNSNKMIAEKVLNDFIQMIEKLSGQ
jgi:hypothetical protein